MEKFMDRKMMFWTGQFVGATVMLVIGQCSSRMKDADRRNPEVSHIVTQDVNDDGVLDLVLYLRDSPAEAYERSPSDSRIYFPSSLSGRGIYDRRIVRKFLSDSEKRWDLNGDGFIDRYEEKRVLEGSMTGRP